MHPAFSLALVVAILPTSQGAAATFTDRATFETALAGAPQTLETFEDEATFGGASSGAVSAASFSDFQVTSTPAAIKLINFSLNGAFNTTAGGANYLVADTDNGAFGSTFTFVFSTAIDFVGFDYTDYENGAGAVAATFGTETVNWGTAPNGFFGYSGAPISSFSIDTNGDSNIGFDDFAFSQSTAPVPLPASLALLASGFGLLVLRRRTR